MFSGIKILSENKLEEMQWFNTEKRNEEGAHKATAQSSRETDTLGK